MKERKRSGVGPGVNPRKKSMANKARLRTFLEQCARGEAELPTRGLNVNYVALSRLLFSTQSSIKPENRAMREIIEEHVAKHPITYAGDNREIRANAAALGLLVTATPPRAQGSENRSSQVEVMEQLNRYLDQCRNGEVRLPRHRTRPNYALIAKILQGDVPHRSRFGVSKIYKPLIDACFDEVYGANISHTRESLSVTFDGLLSTGPVLINPSATQLAIVDWDAASFHAKMPAVETAMAAEFTCPAAFTRTFESWREIATQQQLVSWLDRVLATNLFRGTSLGGLPWFVLAEMRHHGLLLSTIGYAAQVAFPPFMMEYGRRLIDRFTPFELKLVEQESRDKMQILGLLLCMGPLHKITDFPLRQFNQTLLAMMKQFPVDIDQRNFLALLRRLARTLDRVALEDRHPFQPLARVQIEQVTLDGGWRKKGTTADPLTLAVNPVVLEWGRALRKYIDAQHWKTAYARIDRCRTVLAFLECQPDPCPLHAEDLRSMMFGAEHRLYDWLCDHGTPSGAAQAIRTLFNFFVWFGEQDPSFVIPLRKSELPPAKDGPSKTTKALIPRTILDEAKSICRELIEVALSGQTALPDTIHCAKEFANVLSCKFAEPGIGLVARFVPVLPILLYTVLTLPIRSIQARLLDSGEADNEFPIASPGDAPIGERIKWISNPSPLANIRRAEGWLRRIHDTSVWKEYLGFWINTNKTAAVGRGDARDFGYEIPWQHDELINTLMRLRDWQIANNPIEKLSSRADLSEKSIRPTAALSKLMPAYAYLFRHPKESDLTCWHEPVRYEAVNQFFLMLMNEIEARRRNTPNEVKLILTRDRFHRPVSSIFTVHGLRVAGITAFAEAGVPAPIIAEFLAGHMTVLMTVYYQKFGPATVTRMLNDALQALDRERISNALSGASDIEHLRGKFVSEQVDAFITAADTTPSLWALKIDGICPNGQTKCAEGGARHHTSVYGPVPGGARNCPLCRFWLTGPAFIAGQAITLNAQLYRLREKSEVLVSLHARLRTLDASDGKRDATEHSIDAIEAEIDLMISTLQARYRLVMASLQLSERERPTGENPTFSMVSRGGRDDAERSLTDVTDFRMLDFLSRSVEIFPEIDCGSAVFKRNLFLDNLLEKEGFDAMLFRLPTEAAHRAGNALGKFLGDLAGDEILDDIADGTRTLQSFGIERIQEGMEKIMGHPVRFVLHTSPDAPRPKRRLSSK
ncbi:putative integrase [Paraburkholderia sp. BL6665CI2N2]|uniref:VPA1269 family protein n=1 Tax=Paraburkholderia sp. BL6665CI2N2 TaxID=1938806 RepID=UPI0010647262|nr:VPA1269 family protein [Paraburkholderia sp. BL6665CI2N2]TDY23502.1 putative integrase [Paraburkholderia sp. BL6665CI2N2]